MIFFIVDQKVIAVLVIFSNIYDSWVIKGKEFVSMHFHELYQL